MKQKGAILGLVIIVAALGFSATAFKSSLVNYIPFTEALKATDTTVQIMGAPVQGTMAYDDAAHALRFVLDDGQGHQMPVVYHGPKPEDMDSAAAKGTKIAVQGTYQPTVQAVRPTRASSSPTSCWSSARPSTTAPAAPRNAPTGRREDTEQNSQRMNSPLVAFG